MARTRHFNVKKVNFRIKVTRVRRDVPCGYRALGGEVDWKENAFEVDHCGTPLPAILHDQHHRGFSAFSSRSTNSRISLLRHFAHMGH